MNAETFKLLLKERDNNSWLKYGGPTGGAANRCTWNVRKCIDGTPNPKIIYNVVFLKAEPVVRLELYTDNAKADNFENRVKSYPPAKGHWESSRNEPGLVFEIEKNRRTDAMVYDEIMQTLTAWHEQYNAFLCG